MTTTIYRGFYPTRYGLLHLYDDNGNDSFEDLHSAVDFARKVAMQEGLKTEVHAIVVSDKGEHLANDIVWTYEETFQERAERLADSFK